MGAALALIAIATVVGTAMRFEDPLSSPVIPAEDPYNHMALVREHMRDGEVRPLYEGASLYPPGMHAVLAATWSYTGAELYEIVRLGPVLLGAIGILGVALLLGRWEGLAAAGVGAFAFAMAPEIVFRGTMMAPTAFDLALLPFLLFALVALAQGRLRWAAVALPVTVFFAFAHPWLFVVVAGGGAVFLLLSLAFPWWGAGKGPHDADRQGAPQGRDARDPAPERPVGSLGPPRRTRLTAAGVLAALAVIGVGAGMAVWGCSGYCGPGIFRMTGEDTGPGETGGPHATVGMGLLVASGLLLAAVLSGRAWAHRLPMTRPMTRRLLGNGGRRVRRRPWPVRAGASLVLLAALVAVSVPAFRQGLPDGVALVMMFGWPVLALAIAGLLLRPLAPGPVGHLGAGIAAVTYPLTIYNPLDSPFWPHRTAVFLGVGLVLLAGAAAGSLVQGARVLHARLEAASVATRKQTANARADRGRGTMGHGARAGAVVASSAMLTLLLAGAVVAGTPEDPRGGWYRLFSPCEVDALREVSEKANADADLLVVTGSWQSKLVVAAMTNGAGRVWFMGNAFEPSAQEDLYWVGQDRPILMVEERHAGDVAPPDREQWDVHAAYCAGDEQVIVHRFTG